MSKALLAGVGFCILFGLQTVVQKLYLDSSFNPLQFIFLANVTSFFLMTIYAIFFSRKTFQMHMSKRVLFGFLFASFLWVVADISVIFGLTMSSSINFSLLSRLQIFITYIGAIIFLRETSSLAKTLAILIAFLGSVIVVYRTGSSMVINPGDVLFLVFTVAISISGLLRQKISRHLTSFQMSYAMYGISVLVLGCVTSLFAPISDLQIPWFIVGVSILGLSGFICVNYAISRGGATFFSIVSNLLPVTTAVFSFLLLRDMPTGQQIIGGIMILVSILLFTRNKVKTSVMV